MIRKLNKIEKSIFAVSKRLAAICFCFIILFLNACSELEKPKTETFYAISPPPAKQEFRWSNGKSPKSFDPAKASAPPETDIVRAIYDGLTETDTKTLAAKAALAHKWESSEDFKTWTFTIREDARWSNGKKVTAEDFVRSWRRLSELGEDVSHHALLKNIVGAKVADAAKIDKKTIPSEKETKPAIFPAHDSTKGLTNKNSDVGGKSAETKNVNNRSIEKTKAEQKTEEEDTLTGTKSVSLNKNKNLGEIRKRKTKRADLGVKAIGDYKLEVKLIESDQEFPKLVAHPIFRPIYADGKEFGESELNADIVTSGAFRIFSVGQDGITLDRSELYYNKDNIKLERVRFVPTADADSALEAYKKGEIDAVTNANFEPLALKILTPFIDFKRTTHSALNFYEFNRKTEPFNDRRVREALAISIDRERLTEDELEGASLPASNFLPFGDFDGRLNLKQEVGKAKQLLEKAGFANGEGFPTVKLVINRNNIQKRIANSVKRMWKQNLNVETEVIVKESDELEVCRQNGLYDVIRRGVVFPTADETANMLAIFPPKKVNKNKKKEKNAVNKAKFGRNDANIESNSNVNIAASTNSNIAKSLNSNVNDKGLIFENELLIDTGDDEKVILTEDAAIMEVPGIPLYFPRSYSLVKPYVEGFQMNNLDAPSLKDVKIDNNWQPKKTEDES